MRLTAARTLVAVPLAVLIGAGVTACSSGSKSTTAASAGGTSAASQSAAAPGTAATSAAPLSKAAFIARMNPVCADINAKQKALPTPTGPADFANISANVTGTLSLVQSYLSQSETLIAQAADRQQLNAHWLTVEKADIAATRPLFAALGTASDAKDTAKVQAAAAALSKAPDHSKTIAAFMTSYGLTACAALENA